MTERHPKRILPFWRVWASVVIECCELCRQQETMSKRRPIYSCKSDKLNVHGPICLVFKKETDKKKTKQQQQPYYLVFFFKLVKRKKVSQYLDLCYCLLFSTSQIESWLLTLRGCVYCLRDCTVCKMLQGWNIKDEFFFFFCFVWFNAFDCYSILFGH